MGKSETEKKRKKRESFGGEKRVTEGKDKERWRGRREYEKFIKYEK